MYITSDLFAAPRPVEAQKLSQSTCGWNTTTEHPQPTSLGKRRRQADSHDSVSVGYLTMPMSRSSPSRAFTKHQCVSLKPFGREGGEYNAVKSTLASRGESRPIKQARRVNQAIVTNLVVPLAQLSTEADHLTPASSRFLGHPMTSGHDVRPCHVCHKSPMRHRDLANYTTCSRCTERVCYICTRLCAGGCLGQICSTCSREIGEECLSWCLHCLSRDMGNL
jgi:hypothetical protein